MCSRPTTNRTVPVTNNAIDPSTTALVLVDITKGSLRMPIFPHSGEDVLANAAALATASRERGSLVVLTVNAGRPGSPEMIKRAMAANPPTPPARDLSVMMEAAREPDYGEVPAELGPEPGDHFIRKHAWSAFFATDLDLQLRRLGVRTLLIGGVASNFGAESTARDAKAYGYNVILVEDAMRALTAEEHEHCLKYTFPMIGPVRSTKSVLEGFAESSEG
jgi:nicotinamidase-related amidase